MTLNHFECWECGPCGVDEDQLCTTCGGSTGTPEQIMRVASMTYPAHVEALAIIDEELAAQQAVVDDPTPTIGTMLKAVAAEGRVAFLKKLRERIVGPA